MRVPGLWLKRWAERNCDRTMLESVLLPTLADLHEEYLTASRGARPVVLLRGYWAFWTAFVVCLTTDIEGAMRDVLWSLGRSLTFTLAVVVLALTAMSGKGIMALWSRVDAVTLLRAVGSLVPMMLVVALPAALFLAVVFEDRAGWRLSPARTFAAVLIVSISCTLLSFALVATVVPAGNQAYRRIVASSYGRLPVRLRGLAEMSLVELRTVIRRDATYEITPRGYIRHVDLQAARTILIMRLLAALAPIASGLTAFTIVGRRREIPTSG